MTRDTIDDQPVPDVAEAFEGVDLATDPTLLPPGMLSDGTNVMMQGDGIIRRRPGLKRVASFVGAISAANYTATPVVRGLAYYDTPTTERLVAAIERRIVETTSADDNQSATDIGTLSSEGTETREEMAMVQLLDHIFYLCNGRINYMTYSGGSWGFGTVTAFSDTTAMPMWSRLVVHNFRLYAMEANGYKLYASAIGSATSTADWVKTDNIRVGSGEGDPARALVAGQGPYLTMLNARSCWQIDTSDAAVANWTSQAVTRLTGCVEGKTAVQVGQDVFFLAREGVVNLGALAATDSIAPRATLSAAIQPIIDRINWTYISTAFAVKWADFYLLALPLDSNVRPKHIVAFNTLTRRWMPVWDFDTSMTSSITDPDGGTVAYTGLTCGVVANFADKAETLLADNCGRVYRLDPAAIVDFYAGIDGGGSIITSLVTRHMVHQENGAPKQPVLCEVESNNSGTMTPVELALLCEGATPMSTYQTYPTNAIPIPPLNVSDYNTSLASGPATKRFNIRNKQRYRRAAVQLFALNGTGLRLRRITLKSFVDAPDISNG